LRDATAAKALTLKLLNLCLAKHHFLASSTGLLDSRPARHLCQQAHGSH
jgi:hypothetical protein